MHGRNTKSLQPVFPEADSHHEPRERLLWDELRGNRKQEFHTKLLCRSHRLCQQIVAALICSHIKCDDVTASVMKAHRFMSQYVWYVCTKECGCLWLYVKMDHLAFDVFAKPKYCVNINEMLYDAFIKSTSESPGYSLLLLCMFEAVKKDFNASTLKKLNYLYSAAVAQ